MVTDDCAKAPADREPSTAMAIKDFFMRMSPLVVNEKWTQAGFPHGRRKSLTAASRSRSAGAWIRRASASRERADQRRARRRAQRPAGLDERPDGATAAASMHWNGSASGRATATNAAARRAAGGQHGGLWHVLSPEGLCGPGRSESRPVLKYSN